MRGSDMWTSSSCTESCDLMAKPRRRDIERAYSRSQFVAKLRRLADVTFNIEHERADGLDELEFQLRWRTER